jgi:DUF4097 and DUF4098 domain-containing protein YvlB
MTARAWAKSLAVICVCLLAPTLTPNEARAEAGSVHPDGSVNETRQAKPTGVVEVEVGEGSVRIVGWKRAEVNVTGDVEGANLDISASADRTRIRLVAAHGRRKAELEIRVPRGSRIEAKAMSADLDVQGVVGALRLEAVSGDVSAGGSPSEVSAKTVSGSISLDVVSPSITARSVSGAVRVAGARGRATVESVSGECTLIGGDFTEVDMRALSGDVDFTGVMTGQGSFEFRTHSGKIDLHIPKATSADFELRTFSGSIETRLDTPRSTSSALDFRTGKGGAKVRGRTFSGDIEIEATN